MGGVWTGKEEAGVGSQVRAEKVGHWNIGGRGAARIIDEIRNQQALDVQLRRNIWSWRPWGASEDS